MTSIALDDSHSAEKDIERRTIGKASRRLVPLMACILLCAYIDRVNVGFAALQMNADLGLSNTVFGLSASMTAVGLALFAVPSTLVQHRIGARRWIACLAFAWGLASAATAFVRNGEELLLVRFLVGVAEAGFAPGAVLYFSTWFPSQYRGRVIGAFLLISPLGFVLAGPVSSILLSWDGLLGLDGWRWIFIVEALPSILIGYVVLHRLASKPDEARWLTVEEKAWLNARLARETAAIERSAPKGRWSVLYDVRVWLLAAVNLGLGAAGVGITYFMPLIVRSMGFSDWTTGFVIAAPAFISALTLPFWGWWADRAANRSLVVCLAALIMTIGLAGAALLTPSPWALVALSLALIGFNGTVVAIWTIPPMILVGAAAAYGVALIKSASAVGAMAGPTVQGALTDMTGAHNAGLAAFAAITFASLVVMVIVGLRLRAATAS